MINKNGKINMIEEMIKNNDIKELLRYKIIDSELNYDYAGKIKLSDNLSGVNNIENFLEIFKEIVQSVYNLELYMISESDLNLEMEEIYIDIDKNIYFKINYLENNENNLKNLFQSMMNRICFSIDDKARELLKINNYFNTSNYDIQDLLKILGKKEEIRVENKKNDKVLEIKRLEKKKEKSKYSFNLKNLFGKKEKHIKENNLDSIFKTK